MQVEELGVLGRKGIKQGRIYFSFIPVGFEVPTSCLIACNASLGLEERLGLGIYICVEHIEDCGH